MKQIVRSYNIAFYATIVFLILIIGLLFASNLQPWLVFKYYGSATNELVEKTSINEYLAKSIVLPFVIVFVYGLFRIFNPIQKKKKRMFGWVMVVIPVVLFNLFIGILTAYTITSKGKVYRFAAFTQDGWVLSEKPGEAEGYNVPYFKITKDNIQLIRDGEPPEKVTFKPKQEDFFDPKTGRGKVWFEEDENGSWLFYKYPGYSTRSGIWLTRMTSEHFQRYIKWNTEHGEEPLVMPTTMPVPVQQQTHVSKTKPVGQPTVKPARELSGVFISLSEKILNSRTSQSSAKSSIMKRLISAGHSVTENRKKAVYIIDGNVITKELASNVDKYSITCEASVSIKIISGENGSIIDVINISGVLGSATTSSEPSVAAENAIENIAPKIADKIIAKLNKL